MAIAKAPSSPPKHSAQRSTKPAANTTASPSPAGDRVYLGCSGWSYPSWKPGFYPEKTPARQFLAYYASQLNTVEVNYTFRTLPKPATLHTWLGAVDAAFRFSFKAPQAITHFKRLRDCEDALTAFFQSIAPVRAADRLGLVLFQLPPNFKADHERLAGFLADAARHAHRIAFEFRHASWFDEPTFALLREHNAALCVASSDDLATPDVQTADFSCYRLRESAYTSAELAGIAESLRARAKTGDVFAYFKHEDEPSGPIRARSVLAEVRRQ